MIKGKLFLYIFFLLLSESVCAQMERDTLSGGVIVIKDKRYQLLSEKKAAINHRAMIARTPVKGFRLQIMNTTSRAEVLEAKSKMLSLYPEHKLYLIYQAPYFKLRMGNFKDREEAVALKEQINPLFPKGIYIIPSNIEIKPGKDEVEPTTNN
ncbi:MAG: SPOR domain-containing protein [Bacteroidota bacterium]|jgi:hypothetical protein